jgi:type II secretory pathway predicted ATPase ExeA
MYCEYWNLTKPPFDNVPDPSMYVDCHVSMENVIAETIFAIKEGNDCFAVIIGDVGLGKTLSLRIIIDSLEPHKYKIALITNPSISFVQLLREIIGQITGKQCEERSKAALLEMFNHLLFEVIDQGMKIVIFIDEANAMAPVNLEYLRLLTNMQDDKRNLFTLVLAGQMELAQRLEHPKRANLFQRIGAYGRIDKLPSEDSLKTYIETRLKLAGAQRNFFSDDCLPVIWEHSEHGVPRLINKICKLCLKAGEANEFRIVSPEVATQIAGRFQKLSKAALQSRIPRNRPDSEFTAEEISMLEEMEDSQDISATNTEQETTPQLPTPAEDLDDSSKTTGQQETVPEAPLEKIDIPALSVNKTIETSLEEISSTQEDKPKESEEEVFEEVLIGSHKVMLTIPQHIIKLGAESDRESANKMAGYLAAQIMKNNKQLTSVHLIDPVSVWHEIKDVILSRMNCSSTSNSTLTAL